MTWIVPKATDFVLKEGDSGIAVWALQMQIMDDGIMIVPDGVFGAQTKSSVMILQRELGLARDGVAGLWTQRAATRRQADEFLGIPRELLWSNSSYESGGFFGAVNWMVAGGVDCGTMQRRLLTSDLNSDAAIQGAFHSRHQMLVAVRTLKDRQFTYMGRPGTKNKAQLCWRNAVLYHNYPALAERISMDGISGLSSFYTTAQDWVTRFGLKFPDGAPIRTPLEWGQRYSLGAPAHDEPGQAVKFVKDWSVRLAP